LFITPGEFIGRYLYVYGEYEGHIAELFRQVLHEGDVVLDIGANLGVFTVLSARLCGSRGEVHAFEASPAMKDILERNVALNSATNVTIYPFAAGERETTLPFYLANEKNAGLGSLRNPGDSASGVIQVSVRPIDSLMSRFGTVKLIKIDVEGAEPLVLKGARGLIERDRPFLILELSESFSTQLSCSVAAAVESLQQMEYELYNADEGLRRIFVAPAQQANILCVPREVVRESWLAVS